MTTSHCVDTATTICAAAHAQTGMGTALALMAVFALFIAVTVIVGLTISIEEA